MTGYWNGESDTPGTKRTARSRGGAGLCSAQVALVREREGTRP